MTDSPAPGHRYPSRRQLRERAAALPHPESAPASPLIVEPTKTGSLQCPPLRRHIPDGATEAAPRALPRRTLAGRVAQVAAVVGVAGLALTFTLPAASSPETELAAPAASQQRLFSEITAENLPESLGTIDSVIADDSAPQQFTFRAEAWVNYPFAAPVLLTDPFGYRTAPVEQFHDAQDFAASEGTPIQIIADGTVTEAGNATDGCGFGLKVEHTIDGKEVTSRYCHMQEGSHDYSVGDPVKMGDPAGKVGSTGMSFGAHLHLAVRVNDEPVDPMPFLAKYHRMDRLAAS